MANEPTPSGGATGWVSGFRQYLTEVQNETKKITWPAQKEAIAGAIGVVIICTIVALFWVQWILV